MTIQHTEAPTLQAPPQHEGYIDRDGIYDFLAQKYLVPRMVQQKSGVLFNKLVLGAISGTIRLELRCVHCKQTPDQPCTFSRYTKNHLRDKDLKLLEISVSSLKHLSVPEFYHTGTEKVTASMIEDLTLLQAHL